MQLTGLGTVVMFGVAAVLWFAYLVPVWFRRREYLATERNATRLQQTLRIMAETAEVPDAVRAEATARGAAHQERLLRERERARSARERAAVTAARRDAARVEKAVARAAATPPRKLHRAVRRRRLVATLGLLAAIGTAGVQGAFVLQGAKLGVTATGVLIGAAAVGLISISALRSLARTPVAPVVGAAAETVMRRPIRLPSQVSVPARAWTPVSVPKPLYLNTPVAEPVIPAVDADRLLREASEAAREALRAANREAEVVEFPVRPASSPVPATAASSRWASMGVLGDVEAARPDLDEVLKRRRAAG